MFTIHCGLSEIPTLPGVFKSIFLEKIWFSFPKVDLSLGMMFSSSLYEAVVYLLPFFLGPCV